jgi:hypothetical protein
MCHAISTDPNLSPLFEAAAIDHDYEAVKQALFDGRVPKQFPPAHPARQYSSIWSDLSVYDLDGSRIVIPETERGRILKLLHLHQAPDPVQTLFFSLYQCRSGTGPGAASSSALINRRHKIANLFLIISSFHLCCLNTFLNFGNLLFTN